jgi:hypothetical protein
LPERTKVSRADMVSSTGVEPSATGNYYAGAANLG